MIKYLCVLLLFTAFGCGPYAYSEYEDWTDPELTEKCGPLPRSGGGFTQEQWENWSDNWACRHEVEAPPNAENAISLVLEFYNVGISEEHVTVKWSNEKLRLKLRANPDVELYVGISYKYDIWVYYPEEKPLYQTSLAHELAHTALWHINQGFTEESSAHTTPVWWDVLVPQANKLLQSD